jgi:hypothetical protein
MTKSNLSAETFLLDGTTGWNDKLLVDENRYDRRHLLRLAFWGFSATASLAVAFLVFQSGVQMRRHEQAMASLLKRAGEVQQSTLAGQDAVIRLSSAVETLNSDRDRLFARVTKLEATRDLTTGTVAPSSPAPVPPVASVSSEKVYSLVAAAREAMPTLTPAPVAPASKPAAAEPAPPAAKESPAPELAELPAIPATKRAEPAKPETKVAAAPSLLDAPITEVMVPARQTEFGIDLGGGANAAALRRIWSDASKAHGAEIAALKPLIANRDADGSGQLRLIAGPLRDAADAARLCAALSETNHRCEPTVFAGKPLVEAAATVAPKPRPKANQAAAPAAKLPPSQPLSLTPDRG